jgi:hypothetical protein
MHIGSLHSELDISAMACPIALKYGPKVDLNTLERLAAWVSFVAPVLAEQELCVPSIGAVSIFLLFFSGGSSINKLNNRPTFVGY